MVIFHSYVSLPEGNVVKPILMKCMIFFREVDDNKQYTKPAPWTFSRTLLWYSKNVVTQMP